MGSRQQKAQPKLRTSRCDENSKKKHLMKVHDGMLATGKWNKRYGCRRKGLEVN